MAHCLKALVFATALAFSGLAAAGYAQAVPPTGWTGNAGAATGPGGAFTGTRAANSANFWSGGFTSNASFNVGGRNVTMPASARFAANAPRFAAAAVMMHPYVRGAAAVAGWLGAAALVYDVASGMWQKPQDDFQSTSDGNEYSVTGAGTGWHYSKQSACDASSSYFQSKFSYLTVNNISVDRNNCLVRFKYNDSNSYTNFTYPIQQRVSSCPSGWYVTPAGCVQTPPPKNVNEQEFIDELTKNPMPADVPKHIPEPLPIELPEFDPFFVPTGDPVPNPNYDPNSPPSVDNPPEYQPGTEVRPAPTPSSPWNYSTRPVNQPVPNPANRPTPDPTPIPATPPTGGGGGTKPPEAEKGFCDKYPNVIACQVLEPLEDSTKLPEKEIPFEFTPIPGLQGAKSCPSFPNVGNMLGGRQISWQPFCDTLAKLSNLLLAFAWFSAAFIILRFSK